MKTAALNLPVAIKANYLPAALTALPAMSPAVVAQVAEFQAQELQRGQVGIKTHHLLHGGVYSRTMTVAAGLRIVGALIKIPTTVVIDGDAYVWLGEKAVRVKGRKVLPASAGRKQVFQANKETHITMSFATSAKTVEEAEREFTDEWESLLSRRADNETVITGE